MRKQETSWMVAPSGKEVQVSQSGVQSLPISGCDRQQQLHEDVTDINGRDMDDFTMGQQSFLFSPSSDGGEYPECGLLFPQSDENGCPKSTQIDC